MPDPTPPREMQSAGWPHALPCKHFAPMDATDMGDDLCKNCGHFWARHALPVHR